VSKLILASGFWSREGGDGCSVGAYHKKTSAFNSMECHKFMLMRCHMESWVSFSVIESLY